MKNIILIAVLLFSLTSMAQVANTEADLQRVYLSFGTGINSSTGMLGAGFEVPVSSHFGAKISVGVGSWGYKTAVQGKYYKVFPSSWAFGAGYSTASGLDGFESEVELSNGVKSKETFDLSRAHMLDLIASKSWGKRVRFTLDLGYAIKLAGGDATCQDNNVELSDVYKSTFKLISPGGIIIGVGVAIGL